MGWDGAGGDPRAWAPPPPRRRRGPLILSIASLAVIAIVFVVIAPWDAQRRQAISDQITVWQNPPTAESEQIADAVDLTDDARRIFFATLPVVEDADSFNQHCEVEGQTVLGCFDGTRIFVYAVTDERLHGTVEVTAAHELLHAVYQRLSRGERARVDAMVEDYVATIPDDDPIQAVMDTYPADQLDDEWHSRLGTEFGDLPPDLEAYYAQWFGDRSLVLALEEQSTAALDAAEKEIDDLVADIDDLSADLDRRGARYQKKLDALDADIADFNRRADDGEFTSQEQFDQERAALVARSDALDAERVKLNDDTDRYNDLVDRLETLDASYAELYSKLDSTSPPPAVD